MTPTQYATLKTWLAANAAGLDDAAAAAALNAQAVPDYFVWRASVTRSEVYHGTGSAGTVWNWATYKGQSVPEQNAWTQMFMGDAAPCDRLNFRAGVFAIFSGTGAQAAQRDHVFGVCRRRASVAEKLLAVQVTGGSVDTGNTAGQPRGSALNPDNLGYDTQANPITPADVDYARTRV